MTVLQDLFLDALTDYLTSDEARRSIQLSLSNGNAEAKQWARIRNATPLHGYHPDPEDKAMARAALADFFGWTSGVQTERKP